MKWNFRKNYLKLKYQRKKKKISDAVNVSSERKFFFMILKVL
jgi:hypothetical protein